MRKKKAPGQDSLSATDQDEAQPVLDLLQIVMRRRGWTQLDIQNELSWGRSSISQMVTGQKRATLSALLAILRVIGVTPAEFFAERYALAAPVADKVARLEAQMTEVERRLSAHDLHQGIQK